MAQGFIRTAIFSGVLIAFAPGIALGDPVAKKGTTPYVTHFIFRPLVSLDAPGFKATAHEMTGTTENMKGEKMLDKMAARCVAVDIETGVGHLFYECLQPELVIRCSVRAIA